MDLPENAESPHPWEFRDITVAPGRTLRATPVFDTYWRFAARRQQLFMRRLAGSPPPWTDDPVLCAYRFTNAYRAADRVSQYLIRHVLYDADQSPTEVFFRAILFKMFNRIETWEALSTAFGTLTAASFPPRPICPGPRRSARARLDGVLRRLHRPQSATRTQKEAQQPPSPDAPDAP